MGSYGGVDRLINKDNIVQFFKYGVTAGIATLCDWGVYYVFYHRLGIHYILSAVMSFAVWFVINYVLSIIFVFKKSRHKKVKEIIIVLATSVSALGVNLLCIYVMVDLYGMIPIIAKVIASGICMIYNFVLRKIFVFG